MCVFYAFYLNCLTLNKNHLIINNECKSMVSTILRGVISYANDKNVRGCECTNGYASYYGITQPIVTP